MRKFYLDVFEHAVKLKIYLFLEKRKKSVEISAADGMWIYKLDSNLKKSYYIFVIFLERTFHLRSAMLFSLESGMIYHMNGAQAAGQFGVHLFPSHY